MAHSDCQQEQDILSSWQVNAAPWEEAIRERRIASRERITNAAIVHTITELKPATLLDIGCGEGWLCRALTGRGIECAGIDATAELIDMAQRQGGTYRALDYSALTADQLVDIGLQPVDCAVCNFSLIGKESTESVFANARHFLKLHGYLVVQTLHPVAACGELPYVDGWREGSWHGFPDSFRQPAPWYFRTLPTWQTLFTDNGFQLEQMQEPSAPDADSPASLILVGRLIQG
ncbi:2-polyprenyl-3-methyl-5-hydroxy-6-metoxy-1,4-benzoquinol methylase [Litorivivens lipolytica]|uniref:2-polyprenyl-3-methyl-5-hydroxy-6-metoxy-1, 4-benzoquinol methylase n=1 Tax=Litorivivens lipolytica TaxID=1524264 RepID=A0A7W4W1K7_9GAMM|nr:class I SAM-dependent methyltransferase [Litorivivens lipolytica]MBB3045788.1 2-polyprenyl-3-methyl-5-hydroxy-6-metoxy-1,4-benzoquinol methylase [Litorivivens lipolytica]